MANNWRFMRNKEIDQLTDDDAECDVCTHLQTLATIISKEFFGVFIIIYLLIKD